METFSKVLLVVEEKVTGVGYGKVDLPKDNVTWSNTRWELNPGSGICIPHKVPLDYEPT